MCLYGVRVDYGAFPDVAAGGWLSGRGSNRLRPLVASNTPKGGCDELVGDPANDLNAIISKSKGWLKVSALVSKSDKRFADRTE